MTSKKKIVSNMIWRLAESCGAQGVSFIVSLILARLLLPEDYGVVSLITMFTSFFNLFIDSGFKNALIQKKDADQLDYSTVFYFNIVMGVSLYIVVFVISPLIANFYGRSYMIPYIRIMSLSLILGGINGVQQAVVTKQMQFKRFFYATIAGTIISATVGIILAYMKFGIWALISQKLLNQAINTVLLWLTVKWRPIPMFSCRRLKPMFRYGSKILVSSFINTFMNNLTGLVIGKIYAPALLAYYDKGKSIPNLIIQNLQTAVQSVLFPVIADNQERTKQVRAILRRSVMTSTYCLFPCMIGIAVCAENLVRILYTEKWIEMVPYVQLWCFCFSFYLWHTANLQVIQALGRSDTFLKIEIIKQIFTFAGIVISAPFGVLAMLFSSCIIALVSLYINAKPNEILAEYGFNDQIKDVFPIICLNILMGIGVYFVGNLDMPDALLLVVQILTGIIIYFLGSAILKLEVFYYLLSTIKDFIH